MPIIKIQKHQIEEIKQRRDNKEPMVNIAKDYNISPSYILKLLRKHYNDVEAKPKNLKALKQDIIDRYLQDDITGEGLKKHFGIGRDTVYRAFKDSGIKFLFNYTYSEAKDRGVNGDGRDARIEEAKRIYNTTFVKNKRDLARQLSLCTQSIFKYLKDTTPYRETQPFKDSVIAEYKKLESIRKVCESLHLDSKTVGNILHEVGLAIRVYTPKELIPKRVRKKKVSDAEQKPERKLKILRKTKKDSKRVKMPHELPKMQQGDVKVKKNEKILKTLPEEVRNKGYKLRIDDKTEIYVKDGVSPEVARERFLKRYSNNLKF